MKKSRVRMPQRLEQALRTVRHAGSAAVRPDSRREVRRALADREDQFLRLIKTAVFDYPKSPYLPLLHHVGCTFDDLTALVRRDGIEGALDQLRDQGLYITQDEYKGQEPARRGSATFRFRQAQFRSPLLATLGLRTDALARHRAAADQVFGFRGGATAIWLPPMAGEVSHALRAAKIGHPFHRWFSQVSVSPFKRPILPKMELYGYLTVLALAGVRAPLPRHVPASDPEPVVRWMASALRQGKRVALGTYAASAARACRWAFEHGISLKGVTIRVGGESVTPAKRNLIEQSGARCLPSFGSRETGHASQACLAPNDADDMHLSKDLWALTTRRRTVPGGTEVDALLFTSVSPGCHNLLINLETGDCGIVERRSCGCPWDELGYDVHFRQVWSFAKLTVEGTTIMGETVFRALEERLPAWWAAGPATTNSPPSSRRTACPSTSSSSTPRWDRLTSTTCGGRF